MCFKFISVVLCCSSFQFSISYIDDTVLLPSIVVLLAVFPNIMFFRFIYLTVCSSSTLLPDASFYLPIFFSDENPS